MTSSAVVSVSRQARKETDMRLFPVLNRAMLSLAFTLAALPSLAADAPAPKEGDWVVRDFRFHTGEVLPELCLHDTTVGAPTGEPVLILHGTTGSGTDMLTPRFAGELFGPEQPLDTSRYFIILPDAAVGTSGQGSWVRLPVVAHRRVRSLADASRCCPHVPTRWKIFIGGLYDELTDDGGF
jgi:hypothetical protein